MPPDQKVDTNTMTRASFGIDIAKHEFASALIYKLQRKNHLKSNHQSNVNNTSIEDTLTSIQLLVIWGSDNRHNFSARALLIKHSNTMTWDENTLKKLYYMHHTLLGDDHNIKDIWLLDDTTILMTILKWKEENHTFEIIISKRTRKDGSMTPLWVSPKHMTSNGVAQPNSKPTDTNR
jgi:hypothetical protein